MKSVHLCPTARVGRRDHGAAQERNPRHGGLSTYPYALNAKLLHRASPLRAGRRSDGAAPVKCGGVASALALVQDRTNVAPVDTSLGCG